MAFYDFKCSNCGEIFSVMCRIADKDDQQCPKCSSKEYEHHHTAMPAFGDPVRLGIRQVDGGFKEVLSKINGNNYKSNLSDKLSRK